MGKCERIPVGRLSESRHTMKKLLSFNKENQDVYDKLNTKTNASQYVCEAVRFYEAYRQLASGLSRIEGKIDHLASQLIGATVEPVASNTERKHTHEVNETHAKQLQSEAIHHTMDDKRIIQNKNTEINKQPSIQTEINTPELPDQKHIDQDLKNFILSEED